MPVAPRRSSRVPKPTSCGCPQCLVSTVNSHANHGGPTEPTSAREALEGPYQSEWKAAMEEELARLEQMQTWELVPRPPVRVLGCTWKFRLKFDSVAKSYKFKARLVAQGFAQQHGFDYFETYSPVIKRKSIRLMFALSAELELCGEHKDVVAAYVNSPIKETVYTEQPMHCETEDNRVVCKLKKCLYGLKQSGREWYAMIKRILLFVPTVGDPCLFYHKDRKLYVGLYVDDLGVWGQQKDIDWFKGEIS